MENASQALIIAGAILLAILIIALGMFIFEQASNRIKGGAQEIGEQAVNTQNAIYEQYMNKRVKGSDVKAFLSKVRTSVQNNSAAATVSLSIDASTANISGDVKKVDEYADDTEENRKTYVENITKLRNGVKSNENYYIKEAEKDALTKEGLIKRVVITKGN